MRIIHVYHIKVSVLYFNHETHSNLGFTDDLKLIGSKFDPSEPMEKEHNPEIHDMKKQTTPSLQSSQSNPTPGLPFNPLASLTPEQIQQLALLQYLQNPFGGLGGLPNLAALPNQQPANPAVIQPSKPIVRTETVYTTNTIPLFFGNYNILQMFLYLVAFGCIYN